MPFSEEVPANFKPSCPCKRRGCPLQRIFEDRAHNKRFFTYQCDKPEIWASCNKTVAPNETDPTKPQQAPPSMYPIHNHLDNEPCTDKCPNFRAKQPAEPNPLKCPFEGCTFTAKNEFALNKHKDSIHQSQQPPATQETN